MHREANLKKTIRLHAVSAESSSRNRATLPYFAPRSLARLRTSLKDGTQKGDAPLNSGREKGRTGLPPAAQI
jgi:hypothetical protein